MYFLQFCQNYGLCFKIIVNFFKYANSKLKTRCAVPNLMQSNGTLADNDNDKAEELNNYFKSVFTNEDLASIPAFENQSDISLEDIL